jgi:hypothetical protein
MGGVPSPRRVVVAPGFVLAAAVALGVCLPAPAAASAGVAGRVLQSNQPVAEALVYAYHVVEKSFRRVSTDRGGEFLFETLPAGLYKIVAHKLGSPPAVLVLARRAAEDSQYVQVELPESALSGNSFWAVRSEVPPDVLRELSPTAISLASYAIPASTDRFVTEISASASRQEAADREVAEMAGAEVDLRGSLGELDLRLEGEFRNLVSSLGASGGGLDASTADGRTAIFRLGVSGASAGRLGISGHTHETLGSLSGTPEILDFAQYRIDYAREFDAGRSTDLTAEFLDETGLLTGSRLAPSALPAASRVWSLQGNYAQDLGDKNRIRTGIRFREVEQFGATLLIPGERASYLDTWSNGEIDVRSTMVVQYGLFSTMSDGSVSLTPRGGLLLRLAPSWQASASASHRFVTSAEDPLEGDFSPMLFMGAVGCGQSDTTCYELQLMRGEGEDHGLRLRGSWRQFDRTIRLFLREDFALNPEAIFFVPGDQLPEAEATIHGRIGSNVATTWTSSYAAGGGGVYGAINNREYVNDIEYYTSMLSAQILPSSTGVYLAFQSVSQSLEPVQRRNRRRAVPASARYDRLELALSQDLSAIFDLASRWAVRVAMEVVRGGTVLVPVDDPDALRHGVSTSVAIRF